VGAYDDGAVLAARGCVGDNVRRLANLGLGLDVEADPRFVGLVELLAQREANADHRDAGARLAQRAYENLGAPLLTLVEDDRRVVAGGFGAAFCAFTTKSQVPRWMRAT
jgi:hypothetical protein